MTTTSDPAPTSSTTPTTPTDLATGRREGGLGPILALAAGIAVLVSSEFLPAGVLPSLAADVGVSEGTAGLAVAATAIAGAFTAPSIAVLLPRTDRRTVLVGLLVVAAVANLAVALAPSFLLLLLGRLVLGIAIAGYWSFAFGAGTVASPGRDHVVATSIALGVTGATIVGVPLGSLLGDAIGWRSVFALAAGLSLVSALVLARMLPSVPASPGAGFAMLRRALANRHLMAGIGAVMLVAFGNFAAYPFIRLAIDEVDPGATTWLLLLWGAGGLVGNLTAGRFAAHLRVVAAVAPVLLAASLLVTAQATTVPVLALGIFVWGLAFNAVPVATQLWVTRVEPEHAESAVALQVTAFQVAITLGAASGGALVDAHGVVTALALGAGLAAGGGVVFAALRDARA
ncbi:MFS transporter [Nocardioides sp.]|uniref:MFS transporter n=1 Tax=Nocardioides sp. TaxID=35761 RepID=UPI002727F699|nr:MFS transporter [Nocardioides sp.]MDO9456267.1 MFS transporter [Nocardioides sp.]